MEYLYGHIDNINITDILDIVIVAIIIFRFLMIVQGTRAVQMLVGICGLAALYWFSLSYHLYSLNWLLNHFFDYFFLILIILFQDQIRVALVALGETKFLGKRKRLKYNTEIEEVVNSCAALAREKVGALIVFEKDQGLLNYSLTGTKIDCAIHSDILYSLFQTNSPLHDGAVVISDGRIFSAGAFLPLSKNINIDSHLGTRHRAALGISEVSDAVVVVVSEETGNINISYQGAFYRMLDIDDLRKTLRKFLVVESESRSEPKNAQGIA